MKGECSYLSWDIILPIFLIKSDLYFNYLIRGNAISIARLHVWCASCSSSWHPLRDGKATDGYAYVVFPPRNPVWKAELETAAAGLALLTSLWWEASGKTLEINRCKTHSPNSSIFSVIVHVLRVTGLIDVRHVIFNTPSGVVAEDQERCPKAF